jgi:hypothetical protein
MNVAATDGGHGGVLGRMTPVHNVRRRWAVPGPASAALDAALTAG